MTIWKNVAVAVFVVIASGCAAKSQLGAGPWIDPGQAVLRAADAPRTGVTGVFALTVQAVGRTDKVHLNSEIDYRDPRNLSVAVMPGAAAELERLLAAPVETLKGKRILVSGTARRTRIDFTVDGQPSGKYYYQTHVSVTQASQIKVL